MVQCTGPSQAPPAVPADAELPPTGESGAGPCPAAACRLGKGPGIPAGSHTKHYGVHAVSKYANVCQPLGDGSCVTNKEQCACAVPALLLVCTATQPLCWVLLCTTKCAPTRGTTGTCLQQLELSCTPSSAWHHPPVLALRPASSPGTGALAGVLHSHSAAATDRSAVARGAIRSAAMAAWSAAVSGAEPRDPMWLM